MTSLRPSDFGKFWYGLGKELSDIDSCPEISTLPMRSTGFADLYGINLTSVGPYRIFGYLSIPKGEGPFPSIYYPPKNASVLEIIPQGSSNYIRSRFVTFSLACRGMRNSDKPYTAMYPGQLTDGLASLETYVYTGIAADIMRGLDYLSSRDEGRKDCVIACGNDNAILAAALHDAVTHVISQPAYLFDTLESAAKTSSYPLEEFNDYLREYPDRKERVAETLEYFNLRWHAQAVTVPTLLMAEYENGLYSAGKLTNLVEDIAGEVSIHESERSSYKDGIFLERWITERSLGPSAIPILPTHWTNKSS